MRSSIAKPSDPGISDVEKEHVRRVARDCPQRHLRVAVLADHQHVRLSAQPNAQPLARVRLVVDDHHAQRIAVRAHTGTIDRCGASGMSTVTTVPAAVVASARLASSR